MPIANLQWLKTLITSLNTHELDFFKKRLELSAARQNRHSKMLDFISKVEMDEEIKKTEKNRKMISATENRLLNYLLDDISLKRKNKDIHCNIKLTKRLLKAQTLFSEGCISRCIEHLNSLLKLPEINQYLFLKEQVCGFKLSVLATTGKQKEYLKTLELKNETEYKRSIEVKAIRIYNQIKLRSNQSASENTNSLLEIALQQIEGLKEKHNSDLINFIHNIVQFILFENKNKLKEAIARINQADKYTESAIINNLIQSHLELKVQKARLLLNLSQLIDSSFYASICNEESPITTITFYRAKKILFINNYIRANHKANNWILNASFKKDIRFKNSDILSWYYLKICHLHSQELYQKCLKSIDFVTTSFKLNHEFNVFLRLHKITLLISLDDLDRADKEIESFRKYIQRNKLFQILEKYNKTCFYNFLRKIKASGYQLKPDTNLTKTMKVVIPASFDFRGYLDIYDFKSWAEKQYCRESNALNSQVI